MHSHFHCILTIVSVLTLSGRAVVSITSKIMALEGLMQDQPLLVSDLIKHAATYHGTREILTRTIENPNGAFHRTNYAQVCCCFARSCVCSCVVSYTHAANS